MEGVSLTGKRVALENIAAAACAASAGVHVALVPEHLAESSLLAAGFAAAAVALLACAIALTLAASRSAAAPTALLLAGLIAAYTISRTAALPGFETEEVDPVGLATQAVQAVGLVAAVHLQRKEHLA